MQQGILQYKKFTLFRVLCLLQEISLLSNCKMFLQMTKLKAMSLIAIAQTSEIIFDVSFQVLFNTSILAAYAQFCPVGVVNRA